MIPEKTTKRQADVQAAEPDLKHIEAILATHGNGRSALIAILGDIQARYRYLPETALRMVADATGVPLADIYSAATFYHAFSLKPKGKHIVQCCLGTACHVRGGSGIAEELKQQLGIDSGETTPDMQFSLETVNCLGACALGPVVVVDGRYFSKVRKPQIRQILQGALTGYDEPDPARDERVFALDVKCPHCSHSLMDVDNPLNGSPSIGLVASVNGKRGWIRLSGLYGVIAVKLQHLVPDGAKIDYSCPHCRVSLMATSPCPQCEAPMGRMAVEGGTLMVCSSKGCSGRMLDLCTSDSAASGDRLTKRTRREVSSRRG